LSHKCCKIEYVLRKCCECGALWARQKLLAEYRRHKVCHIKIRKTQEMIKGYRSRSGRRLYAVPKYCNASALLGEFLGEGGGSFCNVRCNTNALHFAIEG